MNRALKNYQTNNKTLFILLFTYLLILPTLQYFSQITNMNKVASKSVSNYQTDFASCSCNIHPTICDNYCCCDSSCSTSQVSTWTSNSLCRQSTSTVEISCDSVSIGGNIAFDELACVYYSNRGNINYFYNYPTTGNINYPNANKFVAQISTMSSIDQTSTTASSTSSYSSSSSTTSLLKMTKDGTLKYFQLLKSVGGGQCGIGYLNLTQTSKLSSTTNYYECEYHLTDSTCASSTSHITGTVFVCLNGNCSSNQSLSVTPASSDGTTCSNMITSQTITITLSSSQSAYIISSATITIAQSSISLTGNQRYPIKTTVIINKPSSNSGNPGYLLGKSVTFLNNGASFNLFNIGDSSGNCLTSGSTSYNVNFGQNSIQTCASSSPCGSSLYIDSLIKLTSLTINQYASQSASKISISGTNSSFNSCSYQTIILDIVYSQSGWQADPQFYIIGASMSYLKSAQTSFSSKYLKINWIYADPSTIVTPPTNYFYQYFSYLWTPLRQYFGVY